MARKATDTENLEKPAAKERTPKRYKVSKACYIDRIYHEAGDIIILPDESLKADYMVEV